MHPPKEASTGRLFSVNDRGEGVQEGTKGRSQLQNVLYA